MTSQRVLSHNACGFAGSAGSIWFRSESWVTHELCRDYADDQERKKVRFLIFEHVEALDEELVKCPIRSKMKARIKVSVKFSWKFSQKMIQKSHSKFDSMSDERRRRSFILYCCFHSFVIHFLIHFYMLWEPAGCCPTRPITPTNPEVPWECQMLWSSEALYLACHGTARWGPTSM